MCFWKKNRTETNVVPTKTTANPTVNARSTNTSMPFGVAPNGDMTYTTDLARYLNDHPAVSVPAGCKRIPSLTLDEASDLDLFNMTSLTLPEGLEEIGDYAFWGAGITRLILPKGLKKIGENAFGYCSDLREVVFPEGLIEIGEDAFEDCKNLTSVSLPSTLQVLGDDAFSGTEITTLALPDALQSCGWVAPTMQVDTLEHWLEMEHVPHFEKYKLVVGGETLRDVVLPEGLTELKDFTFNTCQIDSIKCPSTLRRIGQSALDGTRIDRLELPDGFEELYAQYNLKRMEYIRVPDSIRLFALKLPDFGWDEDADCERFSGQITLRKDVGVKYFGNEKNPFVVTATNLAAPLGVSELTIPDGCRVIGDQSLAINGYERVILPQSVLHVGTLSFAKASHLSDVFIPSSVRTIGVFVFAQCPRLHKIRYGGTKAQWNEIENVYAEKDKTWRTESAIEKVECTDGTIYFD